MSHSSSNPNRFKFEFQSIKIESLWNRNQCGGARENHSFKSIITGKTLSTMWFIDILCVLQCKRVTSAETKCYTYTKHIKQSANGGFSFYCAMRQEDLCRAIRAFHPILKKIHNEWNSIDFLKHFIPFFARKVCEFLENCCLLLSWALSGACVRLTIIFMRSDKISSRLIKRKSLSYLFLMWNKWIMTWHGFLHS